MPGSSLRSLQTRMRRALLHAVFFGMILGLGLAGCRRKKALTEPAPAAEPTPSAIAAIPPPKPVPLPVIPRKPMEVAQLFQGISFLHKLGVKDSEQLASLEREEPGSYTVEIEVTVKKPRPSRTLEDFHSNDPELAKILGGIPDFPDQAKVSPAFDKIYRLKEDWIRERLGQLDQLLSRHNYYDCETVLEFTAAKTGRRALVFKGDMDVNTDGSDGDRNITVDSSSRFFQPQTSFRWKKQTGRENPFLTATKDRLAELKAEYAVKGLSPERNAQLKAGIEMLSRRVYDLKTWSFLVAATDPFIVLPGFMMRTADGETPLAGVGDYAVVIYGGKAYPAVVGDAGPSFKFGEASLRLCQELNPRSSSLSRPISELKVGYLVFPGTAEEPAPPDLDHWHKRCATLLEEIGLTSVNLHSWENLVQPWPTPTPTPAPTPASEPVPSPAPNPSTTETPAAPVEPSDGASAEPVPAPPQKAPEEPEAAQATPEEG